MAEEFELYVLSLTEKARQQGLTPTEQGVLDLVGNEKALRQENERLRKELRKWETMSAEEVGQMLAGM